MYIARFMSMLVICGLMMWAVSASASILSWQVGAKQYRFEVELATTPQQQQTGLMYRYEMADNVGMLFDFSAVDRPIVMWMKDTYIALDMIFLDAAGVVLGMAQQTTPLSLTQIPAPRHTAFVLEVNAGIVTTTGLQIGMAVQHPIFNN